MDTVDAAAASSVRQEGVHGSRVCRVASGLRARWSAVVGPRGYRLRETGKAGQGSQGPETGNELVCRDSQEEPVSVADVVPEGWEGAKDRQGWAAACGRAITPNAYVVSPTASRIKSEKLAR